MTLNGKLWATPKRPLPFAIIIVFSVLASAALVAPFYYSKPPGTPDGDIRYAHDLAIHLAVMEQFDKVLRSGAIYPRWLPDVNYGYGNAWPNFYPPVFYYLSSLVNAVANNWINTLFVVTTLGLAASGLAFYVLARAFFGKAASTIGAVLYALLPYHLIDFFWRGAMPEFLSFVLLPLIFLFCYKAGSKGSASNYAGLGLSYGLCLMLHTPIAYLFSYVLVLYALTWAIAERDWRIARRIFLGMTVGVFLSAIYWLPAALEIKYAAETVTRLFQYHKNYITQLSPDGLYERLLRQTFAIQSTALVFMITAWLALAWRESGRSDHPGSAEESAARSRQIGIWAFLGMLAAFMNLSMSYPIARLIPQIEIVAFPSRWMAFVCLFTALMTGAVAERLINRGRPHLRAAPAYLGGGLAAVAVVAASLWFTVESVVVGSRSNPMVTPYKEFLVDTYCPKGVGATANLPRTERLNTYPATAGGEVKQWEPLYRQAVITTSEPAIARFRTFNFPGWSARLDGNDVHITSDGTQAQVISVPPGTHTVEIMFTGTLPRYAGAFLSLVGGLAISGLIAAGRLPFYAPRKPTKVILDGFAQVPANGEAEPASLAGPNEGLPARRTNPTKLIWNLSAGAVVLVAGVWCVAMLIEEFSLFEKKVSPSSYTPRAAIGEGSEANLSVGKSDAVVVAVDESALTDLLTAIARRDEQKLAALIESGRSFRVEQNTRVRILKVISGKARVAILDGSNASREGWVLEGWLK